MAQAFSPIKPHGAFRDPSETFEVVFGGANWASSSGEGCGGGGGLRTRDDYRHERRPIERELLEGGKRYLGLAVADAIDTLVEYLRTSRPVAVVRNPASAANETYIASLEGGVSIIAKSGGPHPNIKPEAAAWHMARLLGWEDMVAVTILAAFRPSPRHEMRDSSLQVAWHPHEVGADLDSLPLDDVWRGAVFDAVVMHRDRHPGNWLACPPVSSGEPRLKLIDHGHTWDASGQPSSRIYERMQGQPVP